MCVVGVWGWFLGAWRGWLVFWVCAWPGVGCLVWLVWVAGVCFGAGWCGRGCWCLAGLGRGACAASSVVSPHAVGLFSRLRVPLVVFLDGFERLGSFLKRVLKTARSSTRFRPSTDQFWKCTFLLSKNDIFGLHEYAQWSWNTFNCE